MQATEVQLHAGVRELPRQGEADDGAAPVMLPEFMYPLLMLSAGLWVAALLKRHYVAARNRIRTRVAGARLDHDAGNA